MSDVTKEDMDRRKLFFGFLRNHVRQHEKSVILAVVIMDSRGYLRDVYLKSPHRVVAVDFDPRQVKEIPEDAKLEFYSTTVPGYSTALFDLAGILEVDEDGLLMSVATTGNGYILVTDQPIDSNEHDMISYYMPGDLSNIAIFHDLDRLSEQEREKAQG